MLLEAREDVGRAVTEMDNALVGAALEVDARWATAKYSRRQYASEGCWVGAGLGCGWSLAGGTPCGSKRSLYAVRGLDYGSGEWKSKRGEEEKSGAARHRVGGRLYTYAQSGLSGGRGGEWEAGGRAGGHGQVSSVGIRARQLRSVGIIPSSDVGLCVSAGAGGCAFVQDC